jgi:zinc/manganese transport system substrate-binding protein
MMRAIERRAAVAIAVVLVSLGLGACGDAAGGDELRVVATTTILGDVARNVVDGDATVEVLLPVGVDPHDYRPSSQQVVAIAEADLVIANGLGLEEGLGDVLENAERDGATVLSIAESVDPLPFAYAHDHDEDEVDPDGDPHVWLDPIRVAAAVRLIAQAMSSVDPTVDWASRADVYAGELLDVDEQIREILSVVPDERRKLVTNHAALGYFADRYGFDVIGTVIPGGATLAEPSSAELAALVATIEEEDVPAIFAETTDPAVLAKAVAAEVGSGVEVVELYTGSLGEAGSGADTLAGLLLTDASLIAAALS